MQTDILKETERRMKYEPSEQAVAEEAGDNAEAPVNEVPKKNKKGKTGKKGRTGRWNM